MAEESNNSDEVIVTVHADGDVSGGTDTEASIFSSTETPTPASKPKEEPKSRSNDFGVGYNRIRIEPLREKRTPGSCADVVVHRLQQLYSAEPQDAASRRSDPQVNVLQQATKKQPAVSAQEETSVPSGSLSPSLKPSPPVRKHKLVHDMSIFETGPLTSSGEVQPTLSYSQASGLTFSEESQQLLLSSKVKILDRRSGKIRTWHPEETSLEQLALQLQSNSSLEVLIPSLEEDSSIDTGGRLARTKDPLGNLVFLRSHVQKQKRMQLPFREGDTIVVLDGEYKNCTGAFLGSISDKEAAVALDVGGTGTVVASVPAGVIAMQQIPSRRRRSTKRRKGLSEEDLLDTFQSFVEKHLRNDAPKKTLEAVAAPRASA
eukprot:Nitzschia sp. Nitz4//scaffold127_size64804//40593//41962//NITZ4_006181-RA/size64804-augustus-gene-0.2-mRNA-1//1//CDS//3329534765//7050//frame0